MASAIVHTVTMGTAVAVGVMTGPSKKMLTNNSSNVDGMVVVSSATSHLSDSSVASEALILNKNDDPGGNI